MSGGPPRMPAPVCLIENAEEGLRTVESALNILRGIQQPVVVVAVVGLYRTGKSYLMNRLAGQQSGKPYTHTFIHLHKHVLTCTLHKLHT